MASSGARLEISNSAFCWISLIEPSYTVQSELISIRRSHACWLITRVLASCLQMCQNTTPSRRVAFALFLHRKEDYQQNVGQEDAALDWLQTPFLRVMVLPIRNPNTNNMLSYHIYYKIITYSNIQFTKITN